MPPQDPFPQNQRDWIENLMPDFLAKLGVNKPQLLNQPEPQDDTDLKEWKDKQWLAFRKEFGDSLEGSQSSWREVSLRDFSEVALLKTLFILQKFKRKFANKKNHPAKATARALGKLLLAAPDPFTGRDIFRESVTSELNALVAERRKESGQDSTAHVGLFQQELKRRWDGLSAEEKDNWVAQADVKNKAALGDTSLDA